MYRHLGPIYWHVLYFKLHSKHVFNDCVQTNETPNLSIEQQLNFLKLKHRIWHKILEGLNEHPLVAKSPNICVQNCVSTTSVFVSKIHVDKCFALLSSSHVN